MEPGIAVHVRSATECQTSIFALCSPSRQVSFAEIKEGREQPAPPSWSGAVEEYTLKDNGKGTTFIVDSDAADEYKDSFEKALQRVKELATQRHPGGAQEALTDRLNSPENVVR